MNSQLDWEIFLPGGQATHSLPKVTIWQRVRAAICVIRILRLLQKKGWRETYGYLSTIPFTLGLFFGFINGTGFSNHASVLVSKGKAKRFSALAGETGEKFRRVLSRKPVSRDAPAEQTPLPSPVKVESRKNSVIPVADEIRYNRKR